MPDERDGIVKEGTEQKYKEIQTARDTLEESLDDVTTVDVLKWQSEMEDVELASTELKQELNAPKSE